MIETRYDIRYVNPTEKSKSGLGKFLAYTLLLISLLIFLIALVFSNLSKSNSQIIIQKLQDIAGIEAIAVTDDLDVEEDDSNSYDEPSETDKQASKYQEEIKRLTQEREQQKEASKKQLATNQKLKKELELITQQLAKEQKTSKQLSQKVETLGGENSLLINQLAENKKNLAKEKVNTVTSQLEKVEQPKAQALEESEKDKLSLVKEEELTKAEPIIENTTAPEKTAQVTIISTPKKEAAKSQMDAIVEAMQSTKK